MSAYYPLCGAFTSPARLREPCSRCASRGCDCCEQKGEHTESGAKNQREHINTGFAATASKEAMWARPGRRERA